MEDHAIVDRPILLRWKRDGAELEPPVYHEPKWSWRDQAPSRQTAYGWGCAVLLIAYLYELTWTQNAELKHGASGGCVVAAIGALPSLPSNPLVSGVAALKRTACFGFKSAAWLPSRDASRSGG